MFLNCGVGDSWRAPWTAKRSNQSILKKINPDFSLKGPMLKLKLQYFGHLMQRTDSLEKTLMLGKIEGRKRMDGITGSADMSLSKLQEVVGKGREGQGSLRGPKELDSTEQLNNNSLLTSDYLPFFKNCYISWFPSGLLGAVLSGLLEGSSAPRQPSLSSTGQVPTDAN